MHTIKEIPLTELPGTARLARAVLDAKGRCLLAAGSVLTEAARELLQRRGVESVYVEVVEALTSEQSAQAAEQIRTAVMRRFRASGDDPGLVKLRDLMLDYRLSSLE